MQLLLKGEAINLTRAKALNLIHAIVPAADMIKAAKDWIKGGGKADRALGREGFQASRRPGVLQGGHADVPGRQRDLPPRDLRQLSGGARHHELRL